MEEKRIDKKFLAIVLFLLLGGFFIFFSASLGLLLRDGARFSDIAFNQAFFGLFLGLCALFFSARLHHYVWKKYALILFSIAVATTALVFMPGIGLEHGGATRWLQLGPFSFQPAEFLKFASLVLLAAFFAKRGRAASFREGFLPFLFIVGIAALLLLLQPDTGTFFVLFGAALAVYSAAGAPWRFIGAILLLSLVGFSGLLFAKPYLMERVLTFLDPARDPSGAGWQIQQSLIAVGTGGILGQGFGKSVQKFEYLPEPIGDSIFAVAAEEFGFIGGLLIIVAFLLFLFRGLQIARVTSDPFGGLLVTGIVIMIVLQSFLNIASMLGLFPLTGIPLIFISHGGTALLFALLVVGIVVSISRQRRKI